MTCTGECRCCRRPTSWPKVNQGCSRPWHKLTPVTSGSRLQVHAILRAARLRPHDSLSGTVSRNYGSTLPSSVCVRPALDAAWIKAFRMRRKSVAPPRRSQMDEIGCPSQGLSAFRLRWLRAMKEAARSRHRANKPFAAIYIPKGSTYVSRSDPQGNGRSRGSLERAQ